MLQSDWCADKSWEGSVKEETVKKITNMPLNRQNIPDKCVYCGKKAIVVTDFARSY